LVAELAECSPKGELGRVDGTCGLVVHRLMQIGRLYVPAKC
jgi:predicted sugar kinase